MLETLEEVFKDRGNTLIFRFGGQETALEDLPSCQEQIAILLSKFYNERLKHLEVIDISSLSTEVLPDGIWFSKFYFSGEKPKDDQGKKNYFAYTLSADYFFVKGTRIFNRDIAEIHVWEMDPEKGRDKRAFYARVSSRRKSDEGYRLVDTDEILRHDQRSSSIEARRIKAYLNKDIEYRRMLRDCRSHFYVGDTEEELLEVIDELGFKLFGKTEQGVQGFVRDFPHREGILLETNSCEIEAKTRANAKVDFQHKYVVTHECYGYNLECPTPVEVVYALQRKGLQVAVMDKEHVPEYLMLELIF